MQLRFGEVFDGDDLLAYTLAQLKKGLTEFRAREDDEGWARITFLDFLACQRSDWRPEVVETLRALGRLKRRRYDDALMQFYSGGRAAALFVDQARELRAERGNLRTKVHVAINRRDCHRSLDEAIEALIKKRASLDRADLNVLLLTPRATLYPLRTEADFLSAAVAGLDANPTPFPMPLRLGWLRRHALYLPAVAARIPAILESLASMGRPEATAAVGEYARYAGDASSLMGLFEQWLSQSPAWIDVSAPSLDREIDGVPLRAHLERGVERGRQELETAPRRETGAVMGGLGGA